MPRFAKQVNCPASDTLASFAANALAPLARQGVGLHLRACDFCAAESRLYARAAAVATADDETTAAAETNNAACREPAAPQMPLALRLFAESRLAEMAAAASAPPRRRAA